MANNQQMVRRIALDRAAQAARGLAGTNGARAPREVAPDQHVLYKGAGGAGRRVVTHVKAQDLLDVQRAVYLCEDSDHGDRFVTTLPDGTPVELVGDELCHFGGEDPRKRLAELPQAARMIRRLLRNIAVAHTVGHGAGQVRPMGAADFLLSIRQVHEANNAAIEQFYPRTAGRTLSMEGILAERAARAQLDEPLLVVIINSAVGGVGSAISIYSAYYLRHLLDKRGVTNVTIWGVDLGPRAFQGRGQNIEHNYAARMRELDKVYRDGFHHTFVNGEEVTYDEPPYKALFQVDYPPEEWPDGENRSGKLSDPAMDAWLRRVALGVHMLAGDSMHNRLQTLWRNAEVAPATMDGGEVAAGAASHGDYHDGVHSDGDRIELISTFSAALANANLPALEQAIAVNKAHDMLDALMDRCSEA